MKTPEEIKRLANKWALDNADRTMETNSALNRGFEGGYNECQKDNADIIKNQTKTIGYMHEEIRKLNQQNTDKKYTEEEIKIYIKAFHLDVLEGNYSKEKLEWCDNWLKENLNKQGNENGNNNTGGENNPV